MAYTVKKLASLSGVSIRTLHWYDEVGLLKPSYTGANGYRYYEEEQLLMLQQILFFRELGFELKAIRKILGRGDFDKIVALSSHKQVLQKNVEKTKTLIKTIDKTIEHLKGKRKMKEEELYGGFTTKEQQKKYEKELLDRFGDKVKPHFEECERNTKNWTKDDWATVKKAGEDICKDLTHLLEKGVDVKTPQVQNVIRRHYQWLKQFWTPTKETYTGHSHLIEQSSLRKAYTAHHPELPSFIAEGIRVFAETELA